MEKKVDTFISNQENPSNQNKKGHSDRYAPRKVNKMCKNIEETSSMSNFTPQIRNVIDAMGHMCLCVTLFARYIHQ